MAININNNNIQQLHNSSVDTAAQNLSKANNGQTKNVERLSTDGRSDSSTASLSHANNSDSLTLTDSALNLKKLEDSISHLPIVDMQKVEEIQNKIKDGSYSINPDKIAKRFIEMELALSS